MRLKFFIDAHLPQALVSFFSEHDVVHSTELPEGNLTSDKTINALSIAEQRIVITKDSDFYYSYLAVKEPYKLVLVKLGNMRLKDLKKYFEQNAPQIITLMQESSFIILEPEKIRILE